MRMSIQVRIWCNVRHKTFPFHSHISLSTILMCLWYVIEVVFLRCSKLPTHFAVIECLNCLVILYVVRSLHNVQLRHISTIVIPTRLNSSLFSFQVRISIQYETASMSLKVCIFNCLHSTFDMLFVKTQRLLK